MTQLEELGISINPEAVHWMVSYDLPAESRGNLSEETKQVLNSLRTQVWRTLRHKYRCIKLSDSEWLIRDALAEDGNGESTLDAVRKDIKEFKKRYATHGFSGDQEVNLRVFPIATDEDGHVWIQRSELSSVNEEVKKLEKRVDMYLKKGKVRLRVFSEMVETLKLQMEIFTEDFGRRHPEFWLFEKEYMRVMDKMMGTPKHKGLKAHTVTE